MKRVAIKENGNYRRYGIGTSETGVFLAFNDFENALDEAINWNDNNGDTVIVWELNTVTGEVVDTLRSIGFDE